MWGPPMDKHWEREQARRLEDIAIEIRLLTEVLSVQVSGLSHDEVVEGLMERRYAIKEQGL